MDPVTIIIIAAFVIGPSIGYLFGATFASAGHADDLRTAWLDGKAQGYVAGWNAAHGPLGEDDPGPFLSDEAWGTDSLGRPDRDDPEAQAAHRETWERRK